MQTEVPGMMSIKEAAFYLGLSAITLEKYQYDKKITPHMRGIRRYFLTSDIEKLKYLREKYKTKWHLHWDEKIEPVPPQVYPG